MNREVDKVELYNSAFEIYNSCYWINFKLKTSKQKKLWNNLKKALKLNEK